MKKEGFFGMLESFDLNAYETKTLPVFTELAVGNLVRNVQNILECELICLRLTGDFVVVGDLHGHIFDLLRILSEYGFPPKSRYIFLGDYIDRGCFSCETLILIYLLKVCFPDDIFLIRGNHECDTICSSGGFKQELLKLYNSQGLFALCLRSFGYMPLAAIVNGEYCCVHGGIGPSVTRLQYLDRIQKPVLDTGSGIADDLLWSDPSDDIDEYEPSNRGRGCKFGSLALADFLERNNLKMIIRGHQFFESGIAFQMKNRIVTVFSASNYTEGLSNCCGVLLLKADGEYETKVFDSLDPQTRNDISFTVCELTHGNLGEASSGRRISPFRSFVGAKARKAVTISSKPNKPIKTSLSCVEFD